MEKSEITLEQMEEYRRLKAQKKRQIERQNKYNRENYDRVNVSFKKGMRERIEKAVELCGDSSVNAYIAQAVIERLEADEEYLSKHNGEDAQTAQISQEPEQTENIAKEHEKAENKQNNEIAMRFQTIEELNAFVLQKQAENEKRKAEEARETESEQPQEDPHREHEESDGFDGELAKLKARRKQVSEEFEKYGELMESGIKELVDSFGEELKTKEYKTRIIDTFGAVNYDRIMDYMDRHKS